MLVVGAPEIGLSCHVFPKPKVPMILPATNMVEKPRTMGVVHVSCELECMGSRIFGETARAKETNLTYNSLGG